MRRGSVAAIPVAGMLLVVIGCSTAPESETGLESGRALAEPVALPERFGFGSPADQARIEAWDVDVRPDGTGLPPGSGSVEQGAAVYQLRCAACHGPTGIEGPNNRLVGRGPWDDFPTVRTVGSYWPYATTLFDYIRRAMPMDSPGSLTPDETYAVIAWLLHRNDILAADAVLDARSLPTIEMPARDRFVPDDRLESTHVR